MKRAYIFSVLFYLAALLVNSQDVTVRALLDTNKALIGDQLTLKLLVQKPSDTWQVKFPDLKDSLSSEIEIVRKGPVDTAKTADGIGLSQELLITVFDTGFFEVPELPFVIYSSSARDTIRTLPVAFQMLSVKADSTIHDIRGVYRMPLSFRETIPWMLALAGVWLLIWVILRVLRNRKIRPAGQVLKARREPADVIAIRELEKLKDEKPWLNNRIKLYYIRISEILRTYLEDRYQIQAMEQTTDEIMSALKPLQIGTSEFSQLNEILKLSDLVKFAKVIPDTEENAVQVDRAVEFVKNTKLIESSELSQSSKLLKETENDTSSELSQSSKLLKKNQKDFNKKE
jgi:hypothetical protein